MTNPPDQPRDDRRMHEGRKPGLAEPENQGETETLDRKKYRDATVDRADGEELTAWVGTKRAHSSAVHARAADRASRSTSAAS